VAVAVAIDNMVDTPRGGPVAWRAVQSWDLIVVGGGPAGTTVAACAARGGLRVLLLEADAHPRVHVGESLLPGIMLNEESNVPKKEVRDILEGRAVLPLAEQ